MRSYRQKMAVWMQHKPKDEKPAVPMGDRKTPYVATEEYLIKLIKGYRAALETYEPLSDLWEICFGYVFRCEKDLEMLKTGSHEERKGVIEKYGR